MLASLIISAAAITTSYEALIDSADNYAGREQWLEASRLYTHALKVNPGSPLNSKLFSNLGVCYRNLERYDDAIGAFEIALIKEPENVRILSQRASTFILTGDTDKALSDINRALAIDSTAAGPLRLHGQLMLRNQSFEEAKKDFTTLSVSAPDDPWGPAGLAEIEFRNGNIDSAISLFRKALSLGEDPDFRISLISALLQASRLKDAEDVIRESIMLYPRSGELYILRGRLHKILHQNREMEIDKKYAVEYGIDPQIVERYLPSAGR